jgi:hypothetical protein
VVIVLLIFFLPGGLLGRLRRRKRASPEAPKPRQEAQA